MQYKVTFPMQPISREGYVIPMAQSAHLLNAAMTTIDRFHCTSNSNLQSIRGGVFELPLRHLKDMRERYEAQFIHRCLDEVVFDGDDGVITQKNHTLLFQVPMVNSGKGCSKIQNSQCSYPTNGRFSIATITKLH